MNETIISNMIAPLKKGDIFYFLGDFTFAPNLVTEFFARLPKGVQFIWIIGNHDNQKILTREGVTQITPMKEIKISAHPVTLCHFPMRVWNKSHYNAWHLFGHLHDGEGHREFELVGKMLNVNCEFHNYKPWTEDEIIEYMETASNNFDLI